eukprot:Nitzschia sp. Nitz4//scaffold5_size260463//225655//226638//NITZ4_001021-RA/size260463-processed-gene-0.403-mRNA-1//-1//CDS//3329555457//5888//frame0
MDHADDGTSGRNGQAQSLPAAQRSVENATDILGTVRAMRMQEETKYRIENYFIKQRLNGGTDSMEIDLSNVDSKDLPVDPECRFRMSEWCFQIVDFCSFKRETVAIAMSCLDRFVASPSGRDAYLDRSKFQLASMVALYSAVKIHEHEAMDPGLMATLSRGAFTAPQIEEMEARILSAIEFRVNPPTSLAFCNHFLDLIPSHVVDFQSRDTVMELAKFQTEIAVSDVDLMCAKPSTVALAALMNSFDSLDMDVALQQHILGVLSAATHVDIQNPLFRDIRIRLYECLTGQGENEYCSSLSPQQSMSGGSKTPYPSTYYEAPGKVAGS